MSELVIESVGKRGVMLKLVRLQSLSTWFHILNFATLAIISLILLKIFRGFSLLRRVLFPSREIDDNPTILVSFLFI